MPARPAPRISTRLGTTGPRRSISAVASDFLGSKETPAVARALLCRNCRRLRPRVLSFLLDIGVHVSRELSPAPDSQWHRLQSVFPLLASPTEVYATKISSTGVPAASKRVGKGFAAQDNGDFRHACRISVLSPPASSEAD